MPIKGTQLELNNIWQALDRAAIVAITDQTGKIIHVNDNFCAISKYSREEVMGQNHRILNSGFHDRAFFTNLWKTISQGKYWVGEIRNRAKDGSFYWVNTTIAPFLDEAGKPYQYVSIRYDITQRKEGEAQILMQDRLASIGLLASSLAHEIGTPLGVVRGRAEIVANHAASDPLISKNMDVIISQIDRVSKLIHSLLNLARGDRATGERTLNLFAVVSDVLDLLAHDFRKNGIEVINEINPEFRLKISGEPESLHQVALNLVVNSLHAIESAKKRGRESGHFIKVFIESEENFISLNFQDSGIGISNINLQNLFKPFFTTKDVGSGTGLGLATCYRIIESWKGSISVESEEGVGTLFRIKLPCQN